MKEIRDGMQKMGYHDPLIERKVRKLKEKGSVGVTYKVLGKQRPLPRYYIVQDVSEVLALLQIEREKVRQLESAREIKAGPPLRHL